MNKKILISLLFFVLSLGAWAKLLKHQITDRSRSIFTYHQVCMANGVKHLPLVSALNTYELDCMGKTVNVQEFCQNKFKDDPKLLRGFISKKLKEVVCEKGSMLEVSLSCDKKHLPFCKNPKMGCLNLKNIFAFNHKVEFVSFVKKDVDDQLNCIFQSRSRSADASLTNPDKLGDSIKEEFPIDEMLNL
ncbi:MAG: hypothetical protein GY909_05315 [Oligoflexia bacterium]|nr:hypothetical protein [Oligoflexia bacterium]